jgi:hypothetical protein
VIKINFKADNMTLKILSDQEKWVLQGLFLFAQNTQLLLWEI